MDDENMILESLSARRAWIEMVYLALIRYLINVALRKESVDRNTNKDKNTMQVPWSLSARRAWIEMPDPAHGFRDA